MPTAGRAASSAPRIFRLRCHNGFLAIRTQLRVHQAVPSLRLAPPCWRLTNGRRAAGAAGCASCDAAHPDGEADAIPDAAELDGGTAKRKWTRKPRAPEVRQKVSEKMKARERAPEHSQRISDAKTGHQHSLGTRYAMHASALGRQQSAETRMKISRRMKEIHAQRKAAKRDDQASGNGVPRRSFAVATQQLSDAGQKRGAGLVMERAVQEMMQLRQEIARFMAQHEQEFGVKPKLGATERSSPELYDKFLRFVALQDFVRNFEDQL